MPKRIDNRIFPDLQLPENNLPELNPEMLFAGVETADPVLVAVSGGSDSLALLLLAQVWARQNDVVLQAVTIDHGLRPEAAAEAAFVASVCAGLDIDHVTLAWDGIKPSFGIQEAARQSRYSLMENFAHEIGAQVILTGHTRDDQAETVFMRAFRKGGEGDGRGLSGMARATYLYGGKKIMRPLLDCSRLQLRSYLSSMAQSWIEDPSNLDMSFERIRLRNMLERDPAETDKALEFSRLCGRLREYQAMAVADFLKDRCYILPGPVLQLTLDGEVAPANPILAQALQVLIAMAGGQLHLVSRKRLEGVFGLLDGASASIEKAVGNQRLTLGGAVIERSKDKLLLYRERRNLTPLLLEPGEAAIWDGRLHVYNGTSAQIFVEPAGKRQIKDFETFRGESYAVLRRAALWSTPLVHVQTAQGETTPLLPLVEPEVGRGQFPAGLELRPACPAIEHFCPEWDRPLMDWIRGFDRHTAAKIQP